MQHSNIIAFPFAFRPPHPPRREGFPPPPLRADGTPLRPGDRVELACARLHGMQGMIHARTMVGGLTGYAYFDVFCDDGINRMVRQDNLRASGNAARAPQHGGGHDAA